MTDHTSLAAAKFAFIEAIACDPSLSALDLRVNTLLISRYLNSERGDAWPSPARLAEELGASESGVKKSLARLSARWWKQTIKGGGKGHTSHYQPRWETVPATVRKEDQTVPTREPLEDETVPSRDPNRTEPGPKPYRAGTQTVPASVLEPLEEPLEEPYEEPLEGPIETNISRAKAPNQPPTVARQGNGESFTDWHTWLTTVTRMDSVQAWAWLHEQEELYGRDELTRRLDEIREEGPQGVPLRNRLESPRANGAA